LFGFFSVFFFYFFNCVVDGLGNLTNQQGLLPSLPWIFSPLLFSTWHPPFKLFSLHRRHGTIFIASTPKLQPQIALDLLYPVTPHKASNGFSTPLTPADYISKTNSACSNGPIAFSAELNLLP